MNKSNVIQKIEAFLKVQKYPEDVEYNFFEIMNRLIETEMNPFQIEHANELMLILSEQIELYSKSDQVMTLKYIVFMENLVTYLDNYFSKEQINGNFNW